MNNRTNDNDYYTEATAPHDVLKIQILERRNYALESIEAYYQRIAAGSSAPIHVVVSRVRTLFLDVEFMLRRAMQKKEFKELEKNIMSNQINNIIISFRIINRLLDEKKLIKIDVGESYDRSNAETENWKKQL